MRQWSEGVKPLFVFGVFFTVYSAIKFCLFLFTKGNYKKYKAFFFNFAYLRAKNAKLFVFK